MTTSKTTRFPRLRLLLPVLALLALPLAGCEDSGDTPAGPGAGGPLVNEGKAGITASADNANPRRGSRFTIYGYFNDGNGMPVAGTPILFGTEGNAGYINAENDFVPFFAFVTNSTLTAGNGGFSVTVFIDPFTPVGSYTIAVQTSPAASGPFAATYVHFTVTAGLSVAP